MSPKPLMAEKKEENSSQMDFCSVLLIALLCLDNITMQPENIETEWRLTGDFIHSFISSQILAGLSALKPVEHHQNRVKDCLRLI